MAASAPAASTDRLLSVVLLVLVAVQLVLGALVAFLVGLLAIRWTTRAVRARHFWKFGFYCLALGLVSWWLLSPR